MKNPFKKVGEPAQQAPKELKKKVMSDVAAIILVNDVLGLFSINYAKSIESALSKNNKVNPN